MRKFQEYLLDRNLLRKARILCYVLYLVIAACILVRAWRSVAFWGVLATLAVLIVTNTVKYFVIEDFRRKIWCYVVDFAGLLVLMCITDSAYIPTFYSIMLSEYYLSSESFRDCVIMILVCEVSYFVLFVLSSVLLEQDIGSLFGKRILSSQLLNDMVLFAFHFVIVCLAVWLYRKNLELFQTVRKLNENNQSLQQAYNRLGEKTALEERQRIAKDIHDTAGHSITTVIMQTEAAKLIIDRDPQAAKQKIVAANMQARNALAELRSSVHLLSGNAAEIPLKELLARIIADTTNGTDISIRADVDDISLSLEKKLFVCNTLKEGIANGIRHGGASAFYFELKEREYAVSFLLSDNGCGVDVPSLHEGFGLTGMKNQAEALGGMVYFVSQKDEGFEIHMSLPLDQEETV